VLEVLRWTAGRFEERGLPTPRLDAEVLIAAALGIPRVQLYVQFERPLTAAELGAIRESVRRRQAGEPVAYVVGKKEFFGLDFAVDGRVLVPRPDTETLVDEALALLPPAPHPTEGYGTEGERPEGERLADAPPPARIADVGTGSGAIAVTLAKRLGPAAAVFAVDVSSAALDVARANAARHGVAVTFLEGDLAAPLLPLAPFDLVVANLPYVPAADLAALAPEVRSEPPLALDGGADGLELVRRLVVAAPTLLGPGGALALEVGAGQAAAVVDLCRAAGLGEIRLRRDLGAVDRVVSARRPGT
jgi:release factor glutamine methyltransferase